MSVQRPRVNSRGITLVEYSLFAIAILLGSLTAAMKLLPTVLESVGVGGSDPLARSVVTLLVGAFALFVVFGVLWAVALFLDAKRLRAADLDWSPSPALYAFGSFFTAIVPLYYLYKRYEHVSMPIDADRWWYGVVAFVGVGVLNVIVFSVVVSGAVANVPGASSPVVASGLSLLNAAASIALPIAIYRDAAHLRTIGSDWAPNPVEYLVAVTLGFVVPFLPVALLVSGYYLYQRRAHVGVP